MNLLSPISTIMTKDVMTLKKEDTLLHVEEIFKNQPIHHLPVVEGRELIGMVSKSDFLFFKRGFGQNGKYDRLDSFRLRTYKAKSIMTEGLATLEPDDKINVALEVFKENLFHAIPIVSENKLLGIVTTYDIIKNLAESKGATNKYSHVEH